jgi:hypothetical protein
MIGSLDRATIARPSTATTVSTAHPVHGST